MPKEEPRRRVGALGFVCCELETGVEKTGSKSGRKERRVAVVVGFIAGDWRRLAFGGYR